MRTDHERPKRSFAGRLLTSLIVCGLAAGAAGAHVRSVQEGRQPETPSPSSVVLSAELERILEQFREIASPEAPAAAPIDCASSICDVAPAAGNETPAPLEARLEPAAPQAADSVRTGS